MPVSRVDSCNYNYIADWAKGGEEKEEKEEKSRWGG
jgi:hypothetical protein